MLCGHTSILLEYIATWVKQVNINNDLNNFDFMRNNPPFNLLYTQKPFTAQGHVVLKYDIISSSVRECSIQSKGVTKNF
jgi:hypothetical protein